MKLNDYSVLILDFDGVVIESNDIKTRAFRDIFAKFPEYSERMMDFHFSHISLSRFAKFDHFLDLMEESDNDVLKSEIVNDFSSKVQNGLKNAPLVTGAIPFLEKISKQLPVYLASVTPAEELVSILDQRDLRHWFADIYGCPPWTKPEAIRDVLRREEIMPTAAFLIGDSAGDQRAANETGIDFLARDSGLDFDTPLPVCFPDLYQISKYLEA